MISAKFCQYPGKWALKEKFSKKQCHPKRDAKAAFWNELWWYGCGDNPWKFLTFAGAQIVPSTIFSTVGLNFNFQNFRVLGTAKSIQRQPATGTASLILGKFDEFFYERKIFLAFAAMPAGTALLAPFTL